MPASTPEGAIEAPEARSKVKSRQKGWARALAANLARFLSPNAISCLSVVFALLGAAALVLVPHVDSASKVVLLVAAALLIQLRLLANLMDGMVAVENGRKQPSGDLFNELPDRLSDSLLIIAAGYATTFAWARDLAFTAALLALLTEYVRALAGSLGLVQTFAGLIGKPQRMFLLTLASFAALVELHFGYRGYVFVAALVLIVLGSLVTLWQRTRYTLDGLNSQGQS
jgi:phosphatidylglycerophosphate synthase